ncbi:MAG: hypothetical protein KDE26_21275, partial [Bacteroidetes bacterium]|nr:hypothetical protein [Bacteroidota bacterium]
LIFGIFGVLLIGSLFEPCGGGEMFFQFPLGNSSLEYQAVVPYLWLNPIGAGLVILFSLIFSGKKNP